jgi:hypothetical protein
VNYISGQCAIQCNRVANVGFEVLTASMKTAVFWVVAPCSLVETYQLTALTMEAARNSETFVNFYQTTRHYNPEDNHLLRFLNVYIELIE